MKGLLLATGVIAALAAPAAANAASVGQIYGDYSADGQITPCKYSAHDLQSALDSIPTDVQQYDPRFVSALNRALETRSKGDCNSHPGSPAPASGAQPPAAGGGDPSGSPLASDGSPKPPEAPATTKAALASNVNPADVDSDRGFPLVLAILATIVALVLTGAGVMALGRRYGWDLPEIFSGSRPKLTS